MELRLKPSDEDFILINILSQMIAIYTNAHMYQELKTMPEVERLAEIRMLKDWMEELMH